MREWVGDVVMELGRIALAVPALPTDADPDATEAEWHRVVDLSGAGVSLHHTAVVATDNGGSYTYKAQAPESLIATTTVLGEGQIGFGVAAAADFRFDNVEAKGAPDAASVNLLDWGLGGQSPIDSHY